MIFGNDTLDHEYFAVVSKIESNDNPKAKNPLSTASGRFQFIKSTWEGLGFDWKDRFNDAMQYKAMRKFTEQNAAALRKANCAINFATLYGAHFMGSAGFLKIMRAHPNASIETVTTAAQRKANPSILKGSVKDFCDWLMRKTGHSVYNDFGSDNLAKPVPPKGGVNIGSLIFVLMIAAAFILYQLFIGG